MANSDLLFHDFALSVQNHNGNLIATTICPQPPKHDPGRLYNFRHSINQFSVRTDLQYKLQYNPNLHFDDKKEANAWLDVFVSYHKFTGALLKAEELQNVGRISEADWVKVYDDWKDVVNTLFRGYQVGNFPAWTIPCLYTGGKYLRLFAIKADESLAAKRENGVTFGDIQEEDAFDPSNKHEKLEDAARQINRLFGLCIGDRAPLLDSRKWALYYVATLMFKTYFKLNQVGLSKNILRSLQASTTDMPAFELLPKSHRVPFLYYRGVIQFLDEDYSGAEGHLTKAYNLCNFHQRRNVQLILTYLIPTKLITSHKLPSKALLAQYPSLAQLFQPLCDAIRNADLTAFNKALEHGEEEFVKRRIYLTLERGQEVILRNLFRKIFLAGGFEPAKDGDSGSPLRRTRVPLDEFAAALRLAGADVDDGNGGVDDDAVECLIANSIYKNLMKGYIARERRIVVLSKANTFPGTGV